VVEYLRVFRHVGFFISVAHGGSNIIDGVEVREATAEVETTTGAMVQVFLLAHSVPADTWRGNGRGDPP
jgi:hypothetical protein